MTRARLPAALALLVAVGGCGRAGTPVRATRAQPAPAPAAEPAAEPAVEPAAEGEFLPGTADEEAEEKRK